MAMRRIAHPLSDEIFSLTKGDRTISNLLPVLGPPQMPMDFNVEDRLSHERWPVEKLYEVCADELYFFMHPHPAHARFPDPPHGRGSGGSMPPNREKMCTSKTCCQPWSNGRSTRG